MKRIVLLFLISFVPMAFGNEANRTAELKIHSPSLEGNLLGDSSERSISVYLPPSYFQETNRRYPVLYVLHGNRVNRIADDFFELPRSPSQKTMDNLIKNGVAKDMIVVHPDGRNRYGGCQYANSEVSGNWADFIVKELVGYIDAHYRTLAKAESRALVGSSMGGRGVLDLALKFPDTYGIVYAMFPGQMGFERFPREADAKLWNELTLSKNPNPTNRSLMRLLGFAVAFSPNPESPPYFADFPMSLEGETIHMDKEVMQRWAKFDPVEVATKDASPLLQLKALYFDCGSSDSGLAAAKLFSKILTKQNIPHVFEEYEGGHGDRNGERMKKRVLPTISKHLVYD